MSVAEVVVVAAARDQADILRTQAQNMVKASGRRVLGLKGQPLNRWRVGPFEFEIKPGLREIRLGDSRMRVLAADAATGDGTIPTLALVDELHRHRSMELYGLLGDGLRAPAPTSGGGSLRGFTEFCSNLKLDTGEAMVLEPFQKRILRLYFKGIREIVTVLPKKNGKTTLLAALALYHLTTGAQTRQMVTISTAGEDLASPLGQLREQAHDLPTFQRTGCLNQATTEDFAWLEWCLQPDDDRENLRLVKKANPASWHSVSSLRRDLESPSMTPGRWARFTCGVWTSGEDPWVSAETWDSLIGDGVSEGDRVVGAVVPGRNPAIAIATQKDNGAAVRVWSWEGAAPSIVLEDWLVALAEDYDLVHVLYARTNFARSAELLEDQGVAMVESPWSLDRQLATSSSFARMVDAGDLVHDGDELLRAQALRAVIKDGGDRGWSFRLTDDSRVLIAAAMAATTVANIPKRRRPRIHVYQPPS